jgi:hypothetical protein
MALMNTKTYLRRNKAAAYLQERYGAYTTETLAKLALPKTWAVSGLCSGRIGRMGLVAHDACGQQHIRTQQV